MPHLFLIDGSIGTYPKGKLKGNYIFVAKRGEDLSQFLDKVWNDVPDGFVMSMSIFAHAAGNIAQDWRTQQSVNAVSGFFLGEPVMAHNVGQFAKLRSLFPEPRRFICNLLSCLQAANSADYYEPESNWGFSGKNLELVKALAGHLNQYVRAADAEQKFDTSQTGWDRIFDEKAIDFGAWEGSVYLFGPDGSKRRE